MRKNIAGLIGSAIVGSVLALTVLLNRGPATAPASADNDSASGAVPKAALTGESYVLSGFSIVYPFEAAGLLDPDEGWAGVSFTSRWTGDRFPGQAECEVKLFDSDGNVVGSRAFAPLYEPRVADNPPLDVAVSEEPVAVEGSCIPGSGVYAPGSGYQFELSSVEPTGSGSSLTFSTRWLSDIDPTIRRCILTATSSSGQTITDQFTYMAPDGNVSHRTTPLAQVETASVHCSEL